MAPRLVCAIFLGLLALVLTLPVTRMLTARTPTAVLNEKRNLYEIPDLLPRLKRGDPTLASDVNRWFDDRYGFRERLIRTKNEIDFRVFGTSRRVALGMEGWLFLREHDDALVGYERGGEQWRRATVAKLRALATFLEMQGVRLIVLGIPDKGDVHPEYRGRESTRRPSTTQLDKLGHELSMEPALVYIDANQVWRHAAVHRDRYWKTDIHHDYGAARLVVSALVRTIAKLEGRPVPPEPRDFIEVPASFTGDLSSVLGRRRTSKEDSFAYINNYVVDQDTPDGKWEKDSRRVHVKGIGKTPPYDFVFKSSLGSSAQKLPVTVLFGNSFSDMYFNIGIQTYFAEFYRSRNVMQRLNASVANLPTGTRYVVYQFFAPFLGTDMDNWTPPELTAQK